MIAEVNQAYEASGVQPRLRLVERSEVRYTETGTTSVDLARLIDPDDGYMDEVHAMRDRVGARDLGNALLTAASRIEATELVEGVRHLQPKGREQQSRRRSRSSAQALGSKTR